MSEPTRVQARVAHAALLVGVLVLVAGSLRHVSRSAPEFEGSRVAIERQSPSDTPAVRIAQHDADRSSSVSRTEVPKAAGGSSPLVGEGSTLVSGRVVDSVGRAVRDADIVFVRDPTSPDLSSISITRTDDEGTFGFAGANPDEALAFALQVRARGLAPTRIEYEIGSGETTLDDIVLTAGTILRGVVTDTHESPLVDVEVELRPLSRNAFEGWFPNDPVSSTRRTQTDGGYHFDCLPPGTYRMTARAPSYQEARSNPIVTAESGEIDVDPLRLERATALRGRVVDERGEGIANASLTVSSTDRTTRYRARASTVEDGTFRIEHVLLVTVSVEAYAEGFLKTRVEHGVPDPERPLSITLRDGLTLSADVVDAVTNAPIERFASRLRRVGSIEDGRNSTPREMVERKLRDVRGTLSDTNVDEAIRIRRRELSETLARHLSESILAQGAPSMSSTSREVGLMANPGARSPARWHANDATGHVTFEGLEEGFYVIDVMAPEHGMATSDTVRVSMDAPARTLTIALGAGFTLSGVVQTPAGDTVGGTRLGLVHLPIDAPWIEPGRNRDGSPSLFDWTFAGQGSIGLVVQHAIADVRGQFRFEGVAPGTYGIEADAEGSRVTRSEPIDVRSDRSDIVLKLEPAARLHGLVNAIPAGEQPNVRVLAVGGHGLLRTTDVDEEGRYRLADLEPGEYVVRAYLDADGEGLEAQVGSIFAVGEGVTATDLVLSAGEDRAVDLSLAAFAVGSIAASVTIDGIPAHGVRVIARFDVDRARGIWRTRRGYANAAGDCILSNLPTGSNVITIYDGRTSVPLHRARVEVQPDTVLPIDVRLVTGALRGHLTSRRGGPTLELDGTLTLWPGREGTPDDPTQYGRDHVVQRLRVRGGRFEFAHVPAGSCTARLEVPGKSPLDRVLQIQERGLVELEWAIDEEPR